MEPSRPVRLPVVVPLEADQVEAELEAAIELVAAGGARRVVVSGLPDVDAVAVTALGKAQAAGVRFCLARDTFTGAIWATVGPREA